MGGIFLAIVALCTPLLSSKIREDRTLRMAVIVVMLAHQVASALQVYLDGLPTMKVDPLRFNSHAMTGLSNLGDENYAQFLRWTYEALGPSHFLGCQVSNFFFSVALIFFVELLYALGEKNYTPTLVLVFGLLPSCILNTSVTLREAAQVSCFLGLALLFIELGHKGITGRTFFLIPITLTLVYLHQGFAAALAIILPLSFAWHAKARPALVAALLIVVASGGVLVKDQIIESLTSQSTALEKLSSGDLEYIQGYAENVEESRTNFGVSLDLSSPYALIRTGPPLLAYYLFSPLPWQVRGTLDLYGLFESLLRLALFFSTLSTIHKSKGQQRHDLVLLFLLFLSMETVWAAGTANWGTAFRHRVVAWGLLVALGGPNLLQRFKKEKTIKSLPNLAKKSSIRSRRRALRDRQQGTGEASRRPGPSRGRPGIGRGNRP